MRKVLVIDDSLTVRMDLDEAFRAAAWATTLCSSAVDARQLLRSESFDCVILDAMLSDADGIELLREIRANAATTDMAIILLATEAEVADRLSSLAVRADEYVGKPYDRAHVVSTAQRLADRRPAAATSGASVPVVLAVDDSPTHLEALAVQLKQDGYDAALASSPQQAFEQLQTRKVDCILLDMLMPGMSGQEVCRRLKDSPQWRSIPVIMLTGREDPEAILDSFNAGADDYVPKSGDFTVLRARLRAQLRRKASEEEAALAREDMHKKDIELAEAQAVRRQNAVLQGVNRILQQSLEAPDLETLGEACLEVAETLTGSRVGFIGEIGADGFLHDVAISNPGWEACKMRDQAGHRKPPGNFPIHGIYGRVLLDGKSLIVNDPASHPDRIGLPMGHPPLTAFLGVPLIEAGRIAGMIAVGNRPGGYRQEDLGALEVLAPSIAEAIARKRAEQALRQTADELARSNKDLEQFAYVASHDLQEPLRQVQAFVQILQDRHANQFDSKAAECFQFVHEGTVRMSNLVRGLLDYSRVGARGKKHEPVACQALLDKALANLQASIVESHAQVTHDDLPTVMAEPTQLTQLFQNLIGNAIKFRRDGVAPKIHVGCRHDGLMWLFSVKDNGIGIDPEHQQKVFLIFQRLHGRHKYPGTGIGLAICKKIVERHGGTIWIESKVGEGSIFCFTLSDDRA